MRSSNRTHSNNDKITEIVIAAKALQLYDN
jgi:hypothetical protein